jgi:hypothetical protein
MPIGRKPRYSSAIIKAAALLDETRTLFAHWEEGLSIQENLDQAKRSNIFGKASRGRIGDFLAIFRRRYFKDADLVKALVHLANGGLASTFLNPILFYFSSKADPLLFDTVTEFLLPRYERGHRKVYIDELEGTLRRWNAEGGMTSVWGDGTLRRVAEGLLTTLRDFGILEGTVKKRLAPHYLQPPSFAFLAFLMGRNEGSGGRLLHSPDWRLFFLTPTDVERLFIKAQQEKLLSYHAAGSVIRIDFPADTPEAYAHVVAQRADRTA